jgi:SAM-dependent methyltransferase
VRARSPDELQRQYILETGLAKRLLEAPEDERAATYAAVYDELFEKIPDHPQLHGDPEDRRRQVEGRLALLSRFLRPTDTLMEIGAGDCEFSVRAASLVRQVIAVDVSAVITGQDRSCPNLEVILNHGTDIPVEAGSVDLAFSDQLMEHLHPDDAEAQLHNIRRALRPGGLYVCVTPNRCTGPWDVSRHFDEVARGFHLREYCIADIDEEFRRVGFTKLRYYAGGRGRYVQVPAWALRLAEGAFWHLPRRIRHVLRDTDLAIGLFGVTVVATN